MSHRPSSAGLAHPHRGNVLVLAGAIFALGVLAGATVRSSVTPQMAAPVAPARADTPSRQRSLAPPSPTVSSAQRLDPQFVYPADVLRVIDGDTFEARVRVWPGLDVDTKVRLRGIDAPELHARCGDEKVKAEAARDCARNNSGGRRRRRLAGRGGQVRRPCRCPGFDAQHRRRIGGAAQRRVCAQLQRRPPRHVVLSCIGNHRAQNREGPSGALRSLGPLSEEAKSKPPANSYQRR